MKHHHYCHCGLKKHLQRFRIRKFGVLGVTLMGLHILFHIVECLILPTIIVALSGRAVEEQAVAADNVMVVETISDSDEVADTVPSAHLIDFHDSLKTIRLEL